MEYKCYSLQVSNVLKMKTLRHTTMRITRQSKRLTIFKINDTRVRQYSGYSPKGKLRETRSDPRRAKQRNLHHLVDYEEFSHVLVSIN